MIASSTICAGKGENRREMQAENKPQPSITTIARLVNHRSTVAIGSQHETCNLSFSPSRWYLENISAAPAEKVLTMPDP
jgi:hypothetical protein